MFKYLILKKLKKLLKQVDSLTVAIRALENKMAVEMDNLATQVKANTDAEASAVVVLTDLKTRLDAAIAQLPNAQQLNDLSKQLGDSKEKLAAAIVANTPAQ